MLALTVPFWLFLLFAEISNPGQALAYLDPGSGSMILQLLLGGIAGIIVVFKLYWERFKNLFQSKTTRNSNTPPPSEIDE